MRRNKYTHRRSFSDLPRHVRADHVFRLRHEIMKTSDEYGSLFTSHHLLEEGDETNQWMDIFFSSRKDKFNFWNATIDTTLSHVHYEIENLAHKKVKSVITEEQYESSLKIKFTKNAITFCDETSLPQFDGRSYHEQFYIFKKEMEASPPPIHEQFEILPEYSYGTGLHIVVDAPYLTRSTIEETIKKFYDLGEIDWISDDPIFLPPLI